ncbi:MAG: ABATE domain-containing protein [Chloroflexi bacterium]|nr:ABATE domain-containing protein [Chloroflexota bacterium]
MEEDSSKAAELALLGGALCLDFANTVGDHKTDHPSEHLTSYADLVAWSRHAGILDAQTARQMLAQAARRPAAARNVLRQAVALREALYRIFVARADDASPQSRDLDLLNQAIARAFAHARLISNGNDFAWGWEEEIALDRMLWSITHSAADLLTMGNLDRVRQCGDDECGWLFLDTSKNKSRRWCDMNDCGNRAKARRFYTRLRVALKS